MYSLRCMAAGLHTLLELVVHKIFEHVGLEVFIEYRNVKQIARFWDIEVDLLGSTRILDFRNNTTNRRPNPK